MPDRPWLDYAGQSPAELFALMDSHRADSLVVAFDEALGRKAAARGPRALSHVERDCLAVEALEREVNDGGYDQFFVNASSQYAAVVVNALQRAGCPRTAAITAEAIRVLAPGATLTADALTARLQEEDPGRAARLQACDEAYYAAGEEIAARLLAYLHHHPDLISF